MKRMLCAVGLLVLAVTAYAGQDRIADDLRVDGDLIVIGGIVISGNVTVTTDLTVTHNLTCSNVATFDELDATTAYADTIKAGSGANLYLRANDGRNDATLSIYGITATGNLALTGDATVDSLYAADNITLATGKFVKSKQVQMVPYTGAFPAKNTLAVGTMVYRADTLYILNAAKSTWVPLN